MEFGMRDIRIMMSNSDGIYYDRVVESVQVDEAINRQINLKTIIPKIK